MRGSGKRFLQNRIKSGCWTVCILFALLETWLGRRWLNPDGISYLDMSDALARHNWHLLVNPQWSPLYPFLIGLATWLVKPAWRSELPVLHIVNFVVFLGAMTSFEFFLRQVIRLRQEEDDRLDPNRISSLPIWVLELIGYSLFAWGTFVLIAAGLRRISPTYVLQHSPILMRDWCSGLRLLLENRRPFCSSEFLSGWAISRRRPCSRWPSCFWPWHFSWLGDGQKP